MSKFFLTIFAAAFVVSACSGQTDSSAQNTTAAPANQAASEIAVTAPYVVPPFPGRDVAAGFFDLTNTGGADRLISASSPNSTTIEIHNHIEDNGVMRMRRIDGVTIGAGDTVKFEQGGYHLMLFGVTLDEGQKDIDVTLNYERAAPVTLTLPLRQHGQGAYGSGSKGSDSHGSGSHGSDSKGSATHGSDSQEPDSKGSDTKKSGH